MSPPTHRQRQAEIFIDRYIEDSGGVPPSVRELAAGLGISASAAHGLIKRLEARDRLKRLPGRPRTVQLTSTPTSGES
jgi:SOS-response transcriptional repressor LexA